MGLLTVLNGSVTIFTSDFINLAGDAGMKGELVAMPQATLQAKW